VKYFTIFSAILIIPFIMNVTIPASSAGELEMPQGNVILTVTGNIANKNTEEATEFTADMLKKLGLHSFRSENDWIVGEHEFEGIKVEDLMAAVGGSGKSLHAVALNDYSATVPLDKLIGTPALIVLNIDGKK